jgi:hypothetical protein
MGIIRSLLKCLDNKSNYKGTTTMGKYNDEDLLLFTFSKMLRENKILIVFNGGTTKKEKDYLKKLCKNIEEIK